VALRHREKTRAELSLNEMRVLTKIDGLVKLENLANPEINEMRKTIRFGSITIRYFSKLVVPADMTEYFGELYVIVNQKQNWNNRPLYFCQRRRNIYRTAIDKI
jgi:hypothetical protein